MKNVFEDLTTSALNVSVLIHSVRSTNYKQGFERNDLTLS